MINEFMVGYQFSKEKITCHFTAIQNFFDIWIDKEMRII